MKTLLIFLMTLPMATFALDNCVNYPIFDLKPEAYKGVISSVSQETSFYECPSSLLINDTFVAKLHIVKNDNSDYKCVYKFNSVTFICEN